MYDEYVDKLRKSLKPTAIAILDTLRETGKTTEEIRETTGTPKQRISVIVQELRNRGLLYTKYGNTTNGYRYFLSEFGEMFMGGVPRIEREDYESNVKVKSVDVITPKELLSMLQQWSREKWEPKVTRTASYLPLGVSKLYQLAYDDSVGSEITAQDLRDIQYYMAEFRQNLEHTKLIMDRVLATYELWRPGQFARFLLSSGINPEAANSLAIKMAEINRQ